MAAMKSTTTESGGRRGTLTREVLLDAALNLLDTEGLAGLTLRNLAASLGVSAMAAYKHFENKAELVDALAAHALAPLDVDLDPDLPWDVELEAAMRGLYATLAEHPGAIDLITLRPEHRRLDEARDRMLEVVSRSGLTSAEAADTLRSLASYVLGYVVLSRVRNPDQDRTESERSFSYGLSLLLGAIRAKAASGASRDAGSA
jgi:AcrR family transcriptional regulator